MQTIKAVRFNLLSQFKQSFHANPTSKQKPNLYVVHMGLDDLEAVLPNQVPHQPDALVVCRHLYTFIWFMLISTSVTFV